MLNWRKPNTSQYCLWKAELEMYDMEVIHRPGNAHINADALSRLPDCQQCQLKHKDPADRRHVKVFQSVSSSVSSAKKASASHHMVMRVTSEPLPQPHWDMKHDPELGPMIALMRAGKLCQNDTPYAVKTGNSKLKELWKQRHSLRLRGYVLYLVKEEKYRLVVPVKERRGLIKSIHYSVGHGGMDKVIYVTRESYYWPGMEEDIQLCIRDCLECQLTKLKHVKDRAPLQPSLVGEPFERVAIDITGPFRQSKHGYKYILAIVDYFSKYSVLVPLKQVDAETVAIKIFRHWISYFGAPQVIHSDRGANFEAELFKKQCELFGIKKTKTSPYYPQADGLVERLFRTIKPLISATVASHKLSWCEAIPFVEMGLRCSVQSTIGCSPFEVLFGRRMRLPLLWQGTPSLKSPKVRNCGSYIQKLQDTLEDIRDVVARHMRNAIQKQANYYNLNRTNITIRVGDKVLVRVEGHIPADFPKYRYTGPYQVVQKNNYWSYKLKHVLSGKMIDRNYNQLRKLEGDHQQVINRTSRETSVDSTSERVETSHSRSPQMHQHPSSSQIEDLIAAPVLPPSQLMPRQSSCPQSPRLPQQTINQTRYPPRPREPPRRYF
jgi:transposase InsO family protein